MGGSILRPSVGVFACKDCHLQVPLAKPQESFMWEKFAECVRKIRAGGVPEKSWFDEAALCNKLCIAVEESAQEGGKLISLDKWW